MVKFLFWVFLFLFMFWSKKFTSFLIKILILPWEIGGSKIVNSEWSTTKYAFGDSFIIGLNIYFSFLNSSYDVSKSTGLSNFPDSGKMECKIKWIDSLFWFSDFKSGSYSDLRGFPSKLIDFKFLSFVIAVGSSNILLYDKSKVSRFRNAPMRPSSKLILFLDKFNSVRFTRSQISLGGIYKFFPLRLSDVRFLRLASLIMDEISIY